MKKINLSFLKKITIWQIITWVVAIVLAIPAFIFTRNFVSGLQIINLPGVAVTYDEQGTPVASKNSAAPQDAGALRGRVGAVKSRA